MIGKRRRYVRITDNQRVQLVKYIEKYLMTIADASRLIGIPYENAKSIYKIYKSTGRVEKKVYAV